MEFGPGAGEDGGRLVFQGTPAEIVERRREPHGRLARRAARASGSGERRATEQGWLKLVGARGNNLQNLTVEFPLGVLCLVTGVSGAGKSTLVQQDALSRPRGTLAKQRRATTARLARTRCEYDDVLGTGQLEDVVLIDQSPIGRSPRSNPLTYIKAFDPIRAAVCRAAGGAGPRAHGRRLFSFNVEGGRCEACEGDGYIAIDMQFMADVYMQCSECGGRRYRRGCARREVSRRRHRRSARHDGPRGVHVLPRPARKFRPALKHLIDVGLDYLRLGQPATTLSGGEAQRLKLAAHLLAKRHGRTLFMLDEPTTGLHFSDIVQLVDCFDALLDVGHSLDRRRTQPAAHEGGRLYH